MGLFLDVNFKQFWNQTSYTENGFDLVIYMDERFFGVFMYLVLGMTAFLRLEVINLTMLTSYFIIIIIIFYISNMTRLIRTLFWPPQCRQY